jgi:hypothetical protein
MADDNGASQMLTVQELRDTLAATPERIDQVTLLLQAKIDRLAALSRSLRRAGLNSRAVDDELTNCEDWQDALAVGNLPPAGDDASLLTAMQAVDAATAAASGADGMLNAFAGLAAAYKPPSP